MTALAPAIGLVCPLCERHSGEIRAGERPRCPGDGAWMVDPAVRRQHPRDPLLGKTVADRYAILGILGVGGMGAVYRAMQMPVGREVALKVIRVKGDRPEVVEARFRQEAQAISRLRHPCTVTLYDFGIEDDGTLFMALELVEGRTLGQRIRKGPIPYDRACYVMACVMDALVEAHALGLVHRDLKPANIMLAPSPWGREQVKVLDFGIAKVIGAETGEDDDRLTKTGSVFGTPHYMSPEQTYDRPIDGRADIYAAGVVLFEALTGRLPFRKDAVVDLLLAHRHEEAPALDPALGVPAAVEAVLRTALAKSPDERWSDAESMAEALRQASGLPIDDSGRMGTPGASSASPLRLVTPGDATRGDRPSARQSGAPARPTLGTSELMSAELVAMPQVRRMPLIGVVGSVVAGALLSLMLLVPKESPVQAKVVSAAAATQRTPRQKAADADAAGIEAWGRGDSARALKAFTQAIAADQGYAPAYYHAAAVRAIQGDGRAAAASLQGYREADDDLELLRERLEGDPDFDGVRNDPAFRSWLIMHGLAAAPPAPAPRPAASSPAPVRRHRAAAKAKPRRPGKPRPATKAAPRRTFRKTISGGLEVPTF